MKMTETQREEKMFKRFWSKVEKSENGCWLWKAGKSSARPSKIAYGHFRFMGKYMYAHRVMWIIYNGPIPAGLSICHVCDNGLCVRPDHLVAATPKENAQDMIIKKRGRWNKTSANI